MKTIVSLMLLLLTACAMPNYPSVCDTAPPDSLICQKANELGVNVEDMDLLLQMATLRTLDKKGKEKALMFFDAVEKYMQGGILYASLVEFVQTRVNLTAPEILIISRYLPYLNVELPVSDFDKGLLYAHISHQRAILK